MVEYIERGTKKMAIVNNETAIIFAKELTTTAMEQKMISISSNPTETAEFVFEFYKTLYEKFSGKTSK